MRAHHKNQTYSLDSLKALGFLWTVAGVRSFDAFFFKTAPSIDVRVDSISILYAFALDVHIYR